MMPVTLYGAKFSSTISKSCERQELLPGILAVLPLRRFAEVLLVAAMATLNSVRRSLAAGDTDFPGGLGGSALVDFHHLLDLIVVGFPLRDCLGLGLPSLARPASMFALRPANAAWLLSQRWRSAERTNSGSKILANQFGEKSSGSIAASSFHGGWSSGARRTARGSRGASPISRRNTSRENGVGRPE